MHAMVLCLDGVALQRHKGCRGDAHQSTAGARALARDCSMVGLDRAKSVLYFGRGLDGVRQRRATAHRAGQARKAPRCHCAYPCVLCLAPLPRGCRGP